MAPITGAKLGYVIAYVSNVEDAVNFYHDVFGFNIRDIARTGR